MNICQNERCGVEFAPGKNTTGKYCNRSCAAQVNNRKYPKRSDGVTFCPVCEAQKDRAAKACSRECSKELRFQEYVQRWLAGEESGTSGKEGTSSYIRRWLHRRAGDSCERCGWQEANPVTGRVPVQINHINGQWDDNRPENLELICPNCHSLTPNYGNLNKGRGRPGRYT